MTVEEIKEYFTNDKRSLEELVNSLIERRVINPTIAKKYFEYTAA